MGIIDSRTTPISPEYESCLGCHAELWIYSDKFTPEQITALLNIQPTEKNIPDTTSKSVDCYRAERRSDWFLSSEKQLASKDLRQHIDWVLERIKNSAVILRKLQLNSGVKMVMSCFWWSRAAHQGPVLWPEQMNALANLNLEFLLDVYTENDWLNPG